MVDFGAILVLFAFGILLAGAIVMMATLFGQKLPNRYKKQAYESGGAPLGDARLRLDVKFYMVAISFIMFDLETVFLLPWAIVSREFGAQGFAAAMFFVTVLVVGFIYEWRKGGLEWE